MVTQLELKDRYLSKQETAAYLHCSLRQLDYLISRGELRAFKPFRKKLLFKRSDLDAFVERHEKPQRGGKEVA